MKMTVEFRQRPTGDWFVRIVSGKLAFCQIRQTREEALKQLLRGQRWVMKRAAS